MSENAKIEELSESLKKYMNTNYELIKYEAVERSSVIGSSMFSSLLVGLVSVLFVLFISLGISFYLSAYLGNTYAGFIIVGGFYLLFGLILMLSKKQLIERPMRDKIIRKVFSNN
jgi:hypothetical protein